MGSKAVWVFAGLFLMSVAYNALVASWERGGHDKGYMGFIVAVGCGYTLAGVGVLVGWDVALWALACFVASGTPMIAGSVLRYVRERAREGKALAEIAARKLGE